MTVQAAENLQYSGTGKGLDAQPGPGYAVCWGAAPFGWATVALASKVARIAWALMMRGEDYRPHTVRPVISAASGKVAAA